MQALMGRPNTMDENRALVQQLGRMEFRWRAVVIKSCNDSWLDLSGVNFNHGNLFHVLSLNRGLILLFTGC